MTGRCKATQKAGLYVLLGLLEGPGRFRRSLVCIPVARAQVPDCRRLACRFLDRREVG
ncbi:MAG: hypothetical protein ACOCVT_03040 [bacterium]